MLINLTKAASLLGVCSKRLPELVESAGVEWGNTPGGHRKIKVEDIEKLKAERIRVDSLAHALDDKAEREKERFISYREKGYGLTKISTFMHINQQKLRWMRQEIFGENDPFYAFVHAEFLSGKTAKQIARESGASMQEIIRCLNRYGLRPAEVLEEKRKAKKEAKIKRKNKDMQAMAEDLYCYYKEIGRVREVAYEAGIAESIVSGMLMTIPEYEKKSIERRAESVYRRACMKANDMTAFFKDEKEFQSHIVRLLKQYNFKVREREKFLSFSEIDILVETDDSFFMIELKTYFRKKDMCTAFGQAALNLLSFPAKVKKIYSTICVPSDVLNGGHIDEYKSLLSKVGVSLSTERNILNLLNYGSP